MQFILKVLLVVLMFVGSFLLFSFTDWLADRLYKFIIKKFHKNNE